MLRVSASALGIGNWALRPSVSPASAGRAGGIGATACREGLESLAESGAAVRWVAVPCVGVACGEAIFSAPGAALTAFGAAAVISGSAGIAFSAGVLRRLGGAALGALAAALVRFRLARGLGGLFFVGWRSSVVARRLRSICAMLAIKSVSFRRRAETGSRGNRKDRPRTMPPRAPRSKQRRP